VQSLHNTIAAARCRSGSALAPYCERLAKKRNIIPAAFAHGQDIKRSFTEYAAIHKITIAHADEELTSTPNYSTFIPKIRSARPEPSLVGYQAWT